eukprot:872726-Amphidinium_carterae.1
MAMDASDAVMALTRFLDSARHDVAGIVDECSLLSTKLLHLFKAGNCVHHGLTALVLTWLQEPHA